ncbi:MAG TPA: protein kinase [Gemmataceae bacterium]|nr:protein kinase [Gemmataceae bacterium]
MTRESQVDDSRAMPVPPLPALGLYFPRLPGYDIVAELGHGGMGVVYKAFDRRRQRMIALKTLQSFTPSALYLFKQEFRTLTEVTHPNLVTLFEPISDGRSWYFTMELVEGVNFLQYVRGDPFASSRMLDERPASNASVGDSIALAEASSRLGLTAGQIGRLRDALRQLAEGITALHEAGKLHRDIKPGNVLVTPQGRVVLLDFGLAAALGPLGCYHSSQRHLAGTVPYMSPEQAACQPLSTASDWYSVGVMLYEVLTERLPFEGTTYEVLLAKQQRDPSPPHCLAANVPEDLEALCMRLLQRQPGARPAGRDVLQILQGVPIAIPASLPARPAMGMPFLGRRPQLEALHDAFAAVRQGHTKTVLVHGPSGMGKSRLVQHFLDAEMPRDNVVVLTGRCYERASVPYKALDSLVDDLSTFLRKLPDATVATLLPRDVQLLARVFPILRRVPAVAAAPRRAVDIPDAHELRRRAFAALRELLARLGDRQLPVLFLDDLQWGDSDSGLLLAELVRPPDAPVLLLLAGYRREHSDASPCVRALREAQEQLGIADRCEVAVDALEEAEACELARALLGEGAPARQVEAIARESGGNPLFVQELVQYLHLGNEPHAVTLDEVLWARIGSLEPAERRLLEVVSVAGRPLSQELARQAAGIEGDEQALVVRLRAGRLLRSIGSGDREEIETYHDRVRETVTAHLPADTLAAHHGRLAQVLEASGEADPELLGIHLQRAGEPGRAGACYVRAAEQAAENLAFDRAVSLYRRSLQLGTAQEDKGRDLRIRLAEALANAGRGPESAHEYLQAASESDTEEALDLRRRAALLLLTCGHYREGLQTLRPVLDAVGLALPSSTGRALWSLMLLRLRLRLRGLDFTLHPPEEIASKDIRYIDVCWAVGVGLFPLDLVSAWIFLTRALLRALAIGDSFRIARGLALEASFLVSGGGRRRSRLAALALEKADRLARECKHPTTSGLVLLTRGMAAFSDGRWADACDLYSQAEAIFREHAVGVAFEINLARLYSLFALYYRGEIPEIGRRAAQLYREARERGDFLATMLAGLIKLYAPLAADDPKGVRRELAEIREHCPEQGVELLRHNVRIWELNLDLYQGDGAAALRRASLPTTPLERVLVGRSRHLRIPWQYKRGCCFLAAAETATDSRALVKSALRCAGRLRRENLLWANGLAGLLHAGAAACRGSSSSACAALEESIATFDKAGMALYAAVARRRLGECLAGTKGDRLIDEADAAMAGRDIRNPIRMTALYAPGFANALPGCAI